MQEIDATMEREIHEKILQAAYDLYSNTPDWVSFFRNILGISGIVRQLCAGREALQPVRAVRRLCGDSANANPAARAEQR